MRGQAHAQKQSSAPSATPVGMHLTREDAAAYFASKGFKHLTVLNLATMASRPNGDGPPYIRMGRFTYYEKDGLDAWLAKKIAEAQMPQAPLRTGRGRRQA